MLWRKDANNIYVNFCQEEFEERTFERANELLGFQILPAKSNDQSLRLRNLGNTLFATKQWLKAIKLYNTSLCFAQNGSDQISLAYANRSACFLHLQMYDKCLVDIQLAIQANFPERLMPKLVKRKAICLEQIERNEPSAALQPELSFEADENYSCMANVLQVQRNVEFGRHITVKRDIGVGKILVLEKAFMPSTCDKYIRCDTCWKSYVNVIPCTECTSVLFCLGPCEQSPNHKIQCGMRIVDDDYVNDQEMNLLRSILIVMDEFSTVGNLMNFVEAAIASDPKEIPESLSDTKSMYRAFLKLTFDRKTTVKDTFPTQVCFVYKTLMNHRAIRLKFNSKKYRRFLMHLIGHHLCTIQCNSGALLYSYSSPFNIAQDMSENLSILVNYINHSCNPNVSIISFNEFNICITLRPIKNGDQLFVSYFRNDHIKHNTASRQKYLQDICDFRCNCERCRTSTMPKELDEMRSDPCYQYVRKNGSTMNCCTRFGHGTRVLRLCSCSQTTNSDSKMMLEKCVEFLSKYGLIIWTPELGFVVNCYEKALKDQFEQ